MIRIIDSSESNRIYRVRYSVDFKVLIDIKHLYAFRDALRNHERISGTVRFHWGGFHNDQWVRYKATHRIELDHGQKLYETDNQQVTKSLYQLWQDLSMKFEAENISIDDMTLTGMR